MSASETRYPQYFFFVAKCTNCSVSKCHYSHCACRSTRNQDNNAKLAGTVTTQCYWKIRFNLKKYSTLLQRDRRIGLLKHQMLQICSVMPGSNLARSTLTDWLTEWYLSWSSSFPPVKRRPVSRAQLSPDNPLPLNYQSISHCYFTGRGPAKACSEVSKPSSVRHLGLYEYVTRAV